jgi:hypothetical protein
MTTEEKTVLLARMLVVAYLLGDQNETEIPDSVSAMMHKGHDGLNWQAFMPLAKDIMEKIST